MAETNPFNQEIGEKIENWQTAKFPQNTYLAGRYCCLERLDLTQHGQLLFDNLLPNVAEWTYLPYGPFATYEDFSHEYSKIIADLESFPFAIINPQTKQPVGIASYLRINPPQGVIEIGHLHYTQSLQKTAAATEAMYLLMRQAFEELGYRRYEWKCNALNMPSRKAAERLGFTFEGIFRQHMIVKGHNRDTAWFSILDKEWPEIKERLEKWLDPSNFINGHQKQGLAMIK
ncbi:MAG: GNAT family protein [Gammaproteobacteria bacterium]